MQRRNNNNSNERRRRARGPARNSGRGRRAREGDPYGNVGQMGRVLTKHCHLTTFYKMPSLTRSPSGPLPGAVYSVRQVVPADQFLDTTGLSGSSIIAPNTGSNLHTAFAFGLNDLPQASTFQAMFDAYRFDKIIVYFKAKQNTQTAYGAAPNNFGTEFLGVVDFDDASALGGLNQYREYDNCIVARPVEGVRMEFIPAVARGVFSNSGVTTSTETVPSTQTIIDIASSSVPHYGVKVGLSSLAIGSTLSQGWEVEAEYHVSFFKTR